MAFLCSWLPIIGWEGIYEISDHGNVRSVDRAIFTRTGRRRYRGVDIALTLSPRGYYVFGAKCPGRKALIKVHRAVCEAFHGPAPTPLHEVAHNDGDRSNNRAENLRWATRQENSLDRVRHGTESKPRATTERQALEIIARLNNGETQRGIAAQLGLSRSAVDNISRARSWKQLHPLLD